MTDLTEIRKKDQASLITLLIEKQKLLASKKLMHQNEKTIDKEARSLKKEIAQINTIIKEKEILNVQ